MHPLSVRTARDLHRSGLTIAEVSRQLGLRYHTVSVWCRKSMPTDAVPDRSRDRCPRCQDPPEPPRDAVAYTYLLGPYLGDGYLALGARVPVLRVSCADAYPLIMDECERAMLAVLARSVSRVHAIGCTTVQSVAKHWPCLLPQAGRGRKHERPIVLEPWQRDVVSDHPGSFVRGLFHSDGCRSVNRVTVRGRTYAYPRYLLANESTDILALAGWALDLLGVAWRLNRRNSLSVARRGGVCSASGRAHPVQLPRNPVRSCALGTGLSPVRRRAPAPALPRSPARRRGYAARLAPRRTARPPTPRAPAGTRTPPGRSPPRPPAAGCACSQG